MGQQLKKRNEEIMIKGKERKLLLLNDYGRK
jgi:hypothetical protein